MPEAPASPATPLVIPANARRPSPGHLLPFVIPARKPGTRPRKGNAQQPNNASAQNSKVDENLTFQALRQLQANPKLSQRQLAKALGMSLGRTHYCVRALIERGLVKVEHFRTSKNKLGYVYLLTPEGIETKARITARFLERKRAEYDALEREFEQITAEAEAEGLIDAPPDEDVAYPALEPRPMSTPSSYDQDYYLWFADQARLLRAGTWQQLDIEHLAEELEDLGKREKRALRSRTVVLLAHLLKYRFQPQHRSASWNGTLREQRKQLAELLSDSPSLKSRLEEDLQDS